MSWNHWGKVLEEADLDGETLSVFQRFKVEDDVILRAVKSWIIQYNDANWTGLKMQLRADNFQQRPGALIAESTNTRLKTDVFTLENGAKETYWEFSDIKLRAGVWYHLNLVDESYVYAEDSHLAWRKDYPDPVYRENNTPTIYNASTISYAVRFITAKL